MFAACPKCKGWGVTGVGIFKVLGICPNCKGKCFVDEATGKPFGYVTPEIVQESIDNFLHEGKEE